MENHNPEVNKPKQLNIGYLDISHIFAYTAPILIIPKKKYYFIDKKVDSLINHGS